MNFTESIANIIRCCAYKQTKNCHRLGSINSVSKLLSSAVLAYAVEIFQPEEDQCD